MTRNGREVQRIAVEAGSGEGGRRRKKQHVTAVER
jgi:hypothetical protein